MGIYFIAAGNSSKNRKKSLDKGFNKTDLKPYLPNDQYEKLTNIFSDEDVVFVWGANQGSLHHLRKVQPGAYVVDAKNKEIMNIFEFGFYYKTPDTKLQEYIGWDKEKPVDKRRPYKYTFFLKSLQKPKNNKKSYYACAFDQEHNQNWLVGQRYFSDRAVKQAVNRMNCKSEEELLGIKSAQGSKNSVTGEKETFVSEPKKNYNEEHLTTNKSVKKKTSIWQWLLSFFRNS